MEKGRRHIYAGFFSEFKEGNVSLLAIGRRWQEMLTVVGGKRAMSVLDGSWKSWMSLVVDLKFRIECSYQSIQMNELPRLGHLWLHQSSCRRGSNLDYCATFPRRTELRRKNEMTVQWNDRAQSEEQAQMNTEPWYIPSVPRGQRW